ncbi:ABC transporter ATP-binding protein [Paracoccaceae bacterium]|nr:ABC transporter ATP-binding protein [Paracoccaceae bacterium]
MLTNENKAGNEAIVSLPASSKLAIELKDITKRFGHVIANSNVNLRVEPGTIHGIVGENGAGKSTLMNILFGLYKPDSGIILLNEQPVEVNSPEKSISLGIGMVHQHFMLVPTFTVLENVMLGNEGSMLLKSGEQFVLNRLKGLSKNYGLNVDFEAVISDTPVGMQQRVEILKALNRGAKILILDEPTGVLTPQETIGLFDILRSLKEQGVTIVLITHKLKEIMSITDTVSVMRGGKVVADFVTKKTSPEELAENMVGRKVLLSIKKPASKIGKSILEVKNLSHQSKDGINVLKDISFNLKEGEILGIAGVAGNGQSELLDILSGIETLQKGQIKIKDKEILPHQEWNSKKGREVGIAHVPEDRHKRGLVLPFQNYENSILGYHRNDEYSSGFLMDKRKILNFVNDLIQNFDVRPRSSLINSGKLSGGNQQKLVLAREIESNPKILLVGQPTRGVDIGAIERIYDDLMKLKSKGTAILLVSVELDEIMSLSDRIIVMNQGTIVGETNSSDATELDLGIMMSGLEQV